MKLKKIILFRSDVFAVGPSGVLKLITLSFSTKLSVEQVSTLFYHFIFRQCQIEKPEVVIVLSYLKHNTKICFQFVKSMEKNASKF